MAGKKIRTFEGKLGDFLIPGDERSAWVYRLAIIRDDLQFEMSHLRILAEVPTTTDTWHLFYFLRRISVSILDACRIFRHDVPKWIAKHKDAPKNVQDAIRDAKKGADQAWADLELVRNNIGGHVNPEDAPQVLPSVDGEPDAPLAPPMIDRLVASHPEWVAKVTLGDDAVEGTCLHDLTTTIFGAVWPEIKDTDTMGAKHKEYKTAVITALRHLVPMIDALLWIFWSSNPAIKKTDSDLPDIDE